MFFSKGDRDLGIAFKTQPGSQASSRGEAKDSALHFKSLYLTTRVILLQMAFQLEGTLLKNSFIGLKTSSYTFFL